MAVKSFGASYIHPVQFRAIHFRSQGASVAPPKRLRDEPDDANHRGDAEAGHYLGEEVNTAKGGVQDQITLPHE